MVFFLPNDLPDSEFDTYIRTTLTRRHTKETLGNPDTYTILQPSTDFDFLDECCSYFDIEFRIVRIRLDNGDHASHTKIPDICQVQPKISYQPPTKEK
ncbi:hypothetical protein [Acetivibrio ethanolgignens]|uniref:Uncharacterized protein n=1 Tax=Acetivibrio ethanolgignens TaxID=290052 RepID=A0A0V8QHD6_9FIRM|nr:hypothetical protein [Acetivibrio ethanolgignens]KSV59976.1 hypothetical protein ASU35_17720 [Acetivibrio ethanolgignens]